MKLILLTTTLAALSWAGVAVLEERVTAAEAAASEDGRLVALIQAANDAEINAGKSAEQKAQSREVRDFARTMVRQHSQNRMEVAAAAKRAGVRPAEDQETASFKTDAKNDQQMLQGQSGAGFDMAYVSAQAKAHRALLQKLDEALKGRAGGPGALNELFQRTRDTVAAHLASAEKLQAKYQGESSRNQTD